MNSFKILIAYCGILLPTLASANVRLNAFFADHMVVQRETNIPVWGWADADEKIAITTSWREKANTVTKADGTWQLKLKTPKAVCSGSF
jgi:sialate O-acetylesterase